MLIDRNNITRDILPYVDRPFIKVLNGLRRSGKSSILTLLRAYLLKSGRTSDQIISINFESMQYADLKNAEDLYEMVKAKVHPAKVTYLFLDEVQEVEGWEKAVNSFTVDFDMDIYITGSNSRLLSSELSTYLAGRYIEFHILPLSFQETISFYESTHHERLTILQYFDRYRRMGGFPVLHTSDYEYDVAYKIVLDIYSSTILRDTIQRFHIRDIELLERVIKFVLENIGKTFSALSIVKYFKSQYRKIDINTVYNYLHALESAYIIYKVSRYDLKGKEILKTQEKYFPGDIAFLYTLMGYKDDQISGAMEAMVYLELIRRGYTVYIGKAGTKEIDFVAEKVNERIYIQVSYKLTGDDTIEREFSPLKGIKDNYPKYVVTMEDVWQNSFDGIKHIHISDFLLQPSL
ncbi:MAG: ATP-binding protein [Saprospiraceae bacterium]|jgi:predicted AAA+ superfamily ATPase|nr:ATP-binding protein [Saprospiraceae bacterium]